jgi:hypothetical protein
MSTLLALPNFAEIAERHSRRSAVTPVTAVREACAYIRSQAGEGWQLVPELADFTESSADD